MVTSSFPPVKAAKSLKSHLYSISPSSFRRLTISPKLSSEEMVMVTSFSSLFRASTSFAAIHSRQASRMDTPMTPTT